MTAARSSTADCSRASSLPRLLAALGLIAAAGVRTEAAPAAFRFDFGPGEPAAGHAQVVASTLYSPARGYGFDLGTSPACVDRGGADPLRRDLCWSERPFFFSVLVPGGNYKVTVTLGDPSQATDTTLKAESRRLMLEKVTAAAGSFETREFTVNVRTSRLAGGGEVLLNPRERGVLHWDDKLTLEFNGSRPAVAALELAPAEEAITVFLAGDSTVTDQTREPWAAWGQMLPRFFGAGVAVANHGESGETLRAFRAEGRLEKILDGIGAGDYLFIQFGHNDQKPGPNHLEPFTDYRRELVRLVEEARRRGAIPVLVTPTPRRRFDAGGRTENTHGDYPEAVRRTARENGVTLVDLEAAGRILFDALGPERSKQALVHYPAHTFPGQEQELKDDSHFSTYGAYQLARAVAEAIRTSGLALACHLVDLRPYDPGHPDRVESWALPVTPPPPGPEESPWTTNR